MALKLLLTHFVGSQYGNLNYHEIPDVNQQMGVGLRLLHCQ